MSSNQSSKRLQRILVNGIVVFGVAPLALGLLFLLTGNVGVTVPVLTTYYVLAIVGVALLAFERLSKELRASAS